MTHSFITPSDAASFVLLAAAFFIVIELIWFDYHQSLSDIVDSAVHSIGRFVMSTFVVGGGIVWLLPT